MAPLTKLSIEGFRLFGVHHSVLTDLWRLVIKTARQLDVQVVSTTHSRDCVEALGALCARDAEAAEDASLHRLERGRSETTRFSPGELAASTFNGIEVR